MHKCMIIFTRLSGQKINQTKSEVIFLKYCNEDTKLLIKRYFSISPSIHFGKYLGFPIPNNKPKIVDFQYIMDNMKKKAFLLED